MNEYVALVFGSTAIATVFRHPYLWQYLSLRHRSRLAQRLIKAGTAADDVTKILAATAAATTTPSQHQICHYDSEPAVGARLPAQRSEAGKVGHPWNKDRDRKNLPFAQRMALSVFRGMQGDFRDWDAIRTWAADIAEALHQTPAP